MIEGSKKEITEFLANTIARGIYRVLFGLLIAWMVVSVSMGFYEYLYGFDNNVGAEGYPELSLYIDRYTGCHYLSSEHGNLSPRLDDKFQHICDEGKVWSK